MPIKTGEEMTTEEWDAFIESSDRVENAVMTALEALEPSPDMGAVVLGLLNHAADIARECGYEATRFVELAQQLFESNEAEQNTQAS